MSNKVTTENKSLDQYAVDLGRLHRFYDEQYTEVSPRVRTDTIQILLGMRAVVTYLAKNAPYRVAIQIRYLQIERGDALLNMQAFDTDYEQLSTIDRLTQQREVYEKLEKVLVQIDLVFERVEEEQKTHE